MGNERTGGLARYVHLVRTRFVRGPLNFAEAQEVRMLSETRAEERIDLQRSLQAQAQVEHAGQWAGLCAHLSHVMLGYRVASRFGDDQVHAENPFKPETARWDSFEMGRGMYYTDTDQWSRAVRRPVLQHPG